MKGHNKVFLEPLLLQAEQSKCLLFEQNSLSVAYVLSAEAQNKLPIVCSVVGMFLYRTAALDSKTAILNKYLSLYRD